MYQKAREMDYPLGIALALHAIGNTYLSSSTPQVAIKSYKEALEIIQKLPHANQYIKTILSQFILTKLNYHQMTDIEDNIRELESVINKDTNPQDDFHLVYCQAFYRIQMHHLPEALNYIRQTEQISRQHQYPYFHLMIKYLYSRYYTESKEYTQALTTLDELLSHTKAANSYRSLQVLKDRAHILTLMGNSKEACEAYEIFNTYKDSLDAMNYIRQINELHTLYQIDKNELDNLNRQKTILYWSWFTILSIVILIVFFILLVRRGNKKLRQSQQELEKVKKQEENSIRTKSLFLSNMSHEIRTPLNAIIGMTAIAGANINDTNRVKDCLAKISSSGKHLLSLINEILDVSKIESGRIELSEEPFDLSVMLKDLVDINRPQADAKRQKVIIRVKDIVHEEVIGDHVRLQQIYTNLVSNAIKYTPEGGTIDITLEEKNAGSAKIAQYDFTVKDNGIGMSKEYLPHVFDAFSRAERKEVTEQQGTGLGMPIALSAARMMNGDIEVESELGKGSTFTATVFLKIAELDESVYEEFIDLPVLIVDDDEVVCESTHIMLRDLGMKPEYVLSGREAVDRLVDAEATGEQFFAVIIDWIMPGMDGVQTIREIRKRTNGDVPIIVISAYDWTEIEKEARQAGASFFVSKPLFKSRLKQLFVELLGAEPAQKDIEEKLDVSEINLSGKRGLLAEDNDLNAEVAAAFLEAAGFELERALNGQEAFEMVRDHEPGYYDCVFMDMQMPVMNGLDATRAIRDLPREDTDYDALPIFAMTANAFVDDVRKTKEAGMNGHFAKPLDFTVLLTTLHQQLK